MSPKQLISFIVGSYLGDGCIPKQCNPNKRNCYLKIQHSIKQKDYADWKSNLLGGFATTPVVINRIAKGKPYQCVTFNTKVHPFCTRLRKLYKPGKYGNSVKTINNSILSYLDEQGLAIWYMDDGGIVRNSYKRSDGTKGPLKFRGIKIAACSLSESEIEILTDYMQKRWGFTFKVYYSKNSEKLYPVLALFSSEARRFINLIKPFVPECMAYKIDTQQEAPIKGDDIF